MPQVVTIEDRIKVILLGARFVILITITDFYP